MFLRNNSSNYKATKYSDEILVDGQVGKFKIASYRDALRMIMCPWDEELGLPKWKCVLRTCNECPKFSISSQESATSADAPQISFHVYQQFYKCTIHHLLPRGEKHCSQCRYIYKAKKKIYCSMHGELATNEGDCMECELYF